MRLKEAAQRVQEGIAETLTYYRFPASRWRCIRTNNPLERIMQEIHRRTRAVGAFPDGKSALMLAADRLRHIAGTQREARRNLRMDLLRNLDLPEACKRIAQAIQQVQAFLRVEKSRLHSLGLCCVS